MADGNGLISIEREISIVVVTLLISYKDPVPTLILFFFIQV